MSSAEPGAKTVAKVGEYPIHSYKEVVKYVERPVSTIKTWMKFTAVMLAAALLLWQLIEKIRSYIDNPVVVATEYQYMEQLALPGLIICNSQPLRYAYVKTTPFYQILNEVTLNSGVINVSDSTIAQQLDAANKQNLKEFYLNASQPVYDFIVDCKWPSGRGACDESFFKLLVTDYGPCYQLVIPKNKWPNMTAAGSVNSLQIVLNVDQDDSFPTTSSKTLGAFVALFPFVDPTPVVSHIGFNAPPGFETSIAVISETVKRLRKDKKGSCIPNKQLALFQNYTTMGCYLQNQFSSRVNACECIPYNLNEYRNPLASDEENQRLLRLLNSSQSCNAEKQFGCIQDQWEMDSVSSKTVCPDACYQEKYSTELTYSLISANQLKLSLSKEKRDNITRNREAAIKARGETTSVTSTEMQYYKENFIILNIYFKELVQVKFVQSLLHDGLNFAGDIAGTIGIILGFLLTTLGDVVENCQMLYKKVRGIVDPGVEKIIKVIEKEGRVRQDQTENENETHGKSTEDEENDQPGVVRI